MVNPILIERHHNILIVSLAGEVDHSNAGLYKNKIVQEINNEDIKALILDFSHVSFIDSSGIGLILGRYNEMKTRNGIIAISGASNQLFKLLEISGVNSIIRSYNNSQEAYKEVAKYESYRAKV